MSTIYNNHTPNWSGKLSDFLEQTDARRTALEGIGVDSVPTLIRMRMRIRSWRLRGQESFNEDDEGSARRSCPKSRVSLPWILLLGPQTSMSGYAGVNPASGSFVLYPNE